MTTNFVAGQLLPLTIRPAVNNKPPSISTPACARPSSTYQVGSYGRDEHQRSEGFQPHHEMKLKLTSKTRSAGRIDDMAARRRFELPTPAPGLEQRIADALAGDIAADQLAELIADTRTAITQASAAAEAARARAYDPAIVDPTARRSMEAADHLARRLRLALPSWRPPHCVNAMPRNMQAGLPSLTQSSQAYGSIDALAAGLHRI